MAKGGKSLLSQTPTKSKKNQDKYSEIPINEYKYDIENKMIYTGLISEYYGQECKIVKRRQRKSVNYYKVIFNDNEDEIEVTEWLLKTNDEYLLDLEKEANKEKNYDISEEERKIIDQGLEPYKNRFACLNTDMLYKHNCPECGYENRCIYHKKYQYNKVNFN